jgi:hypothetical protein
MPWPHTAILPRKPHKHVTATRVWIPIPCLFRRRSGALGPLPCDSSKTWGRVRPRMATGPSHAASSSQKGSGSRVSPSAAETPGWSKRSQAAPFMPGVARSTVEVGAEGARGVCGAPGGRRPVCCMVSVCCVLFVAALSGCFHEGCGCEGRRGCDGEVQWGQLQYVLSAGAQWLRFRDLFSQDS